MWDNASTDLLALIQILNVQRGREDVHQAHLNQDLLVARGANHQQLAALSG